MLSGTGKKKVPAGSIGFLVTERNPQSNRKALGKECGSYADRCGGNLERSGKLDDIPAGSDLLQMHFCGEALTAETWDFFPAADTEHGCPALPGVARLCPPYSQLPQKLQQSVSPGVCR